MQNQDVHRAADHQDELSLLLPACPASVPAARHEVREFLDGCPDELQARVGLALSEAVANSVVHAYRHRPGGVGSVTVRATLDADALRIAVRDDGCGPAARDDSPGAGVGLLLMDELSDGVSVTPRRWGGTEVCLQFDHVQRRTRRRRSAPATARRALVTA